MISVPSLFRDLSTRQDVANWQPLLRQLDDLLDGDRRPEASFAPPCDVAESDAHYQFTFDVPGLKKDELDIEVAGRRLTVSGERKFELKKDTARAHFVERRQGKFQRSFTLPEAVKADAVAADYHDGVLTVTVPKAGEAKSTKVKIGERPSAH